MRCSDGVGMCVRALHRYKENLGRDSFAEPVKEQENLSDVCLPTLDAYISFQVLHNPIMLTKNTFHVRNP